MGGEVADEEVCADVEGFLFVCGSLVGGVVSSLLSSKGEKEDGE